MDLQNIFTWTLNRSLTGSIVIGCVLLARLVLKNAPRVYAWALWLVVLAAGVALYALVLRRRMWGGEVLWYTLAICLGIAYLLLTAMPPQTGIFLDPTGVPTMAIPV